MRIMDYCGPIEVITILMEPGEKVLDKLNEAIKVKDIKNGALVSGIATLTRCQMHYIKDTEMPPTDIFYTVEAPLEVGSMSGIIADYEPHIHLSSGKHDEKTWVGHLEPDSEVCYLAELCILKFNGLPMQRIRDERGIKLLGPKETS